MSDDQGDEVVAIIVTYSTASQLPKPAMGVPKERVEIEQDQDLSSKPHPMQREEVPCS